MAQDERTQLTLDWPSRPSYLAGDFVVGACNTAAHDLIVRWPDWPHFAVGLHGPAGAGKTHLAHIWAEAADAGVTGVARLVGEGPQALASVRRRWAVDLDVPAGQPDETAESALFHFHNLVQQAGGALLYVSRTPLARWPGSLADLRSRFAACPAVGVQAPDDAVLAAVMAKLAADRQIVLGAPVIAFLLKHIERSFESVADLVRILDRKALAERRAITQALAGEVVKALAVERNDRGNGA